MMSLFFMIRELLAIELDLGAGDHLPEQHIFAGLHGGGDELAVIVRGAGADRDHFAFLGLFLDGVGNR